MKWNKLFVLSLLMVNIALWAQPKPKIDKLKIDGIAAVVGDEIILKSDIEREFFMAKAQGMEVDDPCEFLNNILVKKLLIAKGKQDTLVSITNDQIERSAQQRIDFFLTKGSEEEILQYFGFNTMAEFKVNLQDILKNEEYATQKQGLITKDIDVTPEEVRTFFEEYNNELPAVKEEVEISHIVVYPEIEPQNEQKVIDQLSQIKKDIEEGASFATKAILYSKDPGSASNGGLYNGISRGKMVPEFDAVAFNLQEGEISEPFKTDFGYHIVMLEKRKGQQIDVRHILIPLIPTPEEISKAKNKLDSIRTQIVNGEVTFKEMANRYSVDKYTKYNGGKMTDPQTLEDRFEKSKLEIKDFSAITGLSVGDISTVFEDDFNNNKALRIVKLEQSIPEHKINYETDFTRLKNITIQNKKQDVLLDWVKREVPNTFITINNDYNNCEFDINWRKQ